MSMRVLSCDTGLATFGWALSEFTLTRATPARVLISPLAIGALTTEPSAKKRKVLSVEDTARRLGEIAKVLEQPCMRDPCFPIRLVCRRELEPRAQFGPAHRRWARRGAW